MAELQYSKAAIAKCLGVSMKKVSDWIEQAISLLNSGFLTGSVRLSISAMRDFLARYARPHCSILSATASLDTKTNTAFYSAIRRLVGASYWLNGNRRRRVTRTELVAAVSDVSGQPKTTVEKIVVQSMNAIAGALARGEEVKLQGFGSFSVRSRKGRPGRNPRTGESIEIKPSKNVRFKAGKELKSAIS